jgi:hypothetical protein
VDYVPVVITCRNLDVAFRVLSTGLELRRPKDAHLLLLAGRIRTRTEGEWERAILRSFEVWRELNKGGGYLQLDLDACQIAVIERPARRR